MKEYLINLQEAESNLLAGATYLAEKIKSSDGHAEAMKDVIAHYVAKSDVDLAAQLADTIEDPFVRDRLLCEIAAKCVEIDDDEYGLQLADAVEDYGFQMTALDGIAIKMANKQQFEKAQDIAEKLNHSSEAMSAIAINQMRDDKETDALQTVSQIEFPVTKVHALLGIARFYQEKNETEKADKMLSEAADEASAIEFTEEKIRALHTIALQHLDFSRKDKAIEVLAKARAEAETLDGAHRDNLLTMISLDFLHAGSIDLADRTLDLVADKTQIASALVGYSVELERADDKAEALETIEEAYAILKSQREKEVRDSRARFNLFGIIAARFASLGKAERAIELALENPIDSECDDALMQIAQICAMNENEDLARQALDSIREDSALALALIAISDAKAKLERKEEAAQFLDEAYSQCKTVPQLAMRSAAFNELIVRFSVRGDMEKAQKISLENLQTISRILDESQKVALLLQFSDTYERLSLKLNDAEKQILRTMLRKAER